MDTVQGFLLVVDDEHTHRDLLMRHLNAAGYHVMTAANGTFAHQPDCSGYDQTERCGRGAKSLPA